MARGIPGQITDESWRIARFRRWHRCAVRTNPTYERTVLLVTLRNAQPIWRNASYAATATLLARFKLRAFSRMRIHSACGWSGRQIDRGNPLVSLPKTKTSPAAYRAWVCVALADFVKNQKRSVGSAVRSASHTTPGISIITSATNSGRRKSSFWKISPSNTIARFASE